MSGANFPFVASVEPKVSTNTPRPTNFIHEVVPLGDSDSRLDQVQGGDFGGDNS